MEVDTTIVDIIEAANTLYAQWPDTRPNIHHDGDTPQTPDPAPNILKPVRSCDEGSSARHAVERGRPASLTRLICRYHSVRLEYICDGIPLLFRVP